MRIVGEICLQMALVTAGYAAFASLYPRFRDDHRLGRLAVPAAGAAFAGLLIAMLVLMAALVRCDYRFDYVSQYTSRSLPWHYRLSALWVGQAGSMLLWTAFSALAALVFRAASQSPLRRCAFGILMANVAFLLAVMVLAADPMKASLAVRKEGLGLSPLLQHPSMLIHPPVVFLAYAAWAVPFALAASALLTGKLDGRWANEARPWTLFAWVVLGAGLFLGADWAYQELGWGGYWGWDPVENGSLIPWLTGTALIHSLMAWRRRGVLKKLSLSLAVATFALCNFATFLTRSGIFSSVHAFSQSPIGWAFFGWMAVVAGAGAALLVFHRRRLVPDRPLGGIVSREALVLVSTFLLMLLTTVVIIGTLFTALSSALVGRTVQIGPAFYNNVLSPIGLALLATMAAAPLLRWGAPPTRKQRLALFACCGAAFLAGGVAAACGIRHPIAWAVAGVAVLAVGAAAASWLLDARRRSATGWFAGLGRVLVGQRPQYAGYAVHLGLISVAVGIAGSSLGSQRLDVELKEGQVIEWAGRRIEYVRLVQRETADTLVAEVELRVGRTGEQQAVMLRPSRRLHLLQNEWTTEVDIHSTWAGDFYTILNAGLGEGRVYLSLVDNPLMRWIWAGGYLAAAATAAAAWPVKRRRRKQATVEPASLAIVFPTTGRRALEAQSLTREHGGQRVLTDVDFHLEAGEIVAILGANGAGKSTFLHCLAGRRRPTSGQVLWFGESHERRPDLNRLVGLAAHESYLYPELTSRENLLFAARMHQIESPPARVAELLAKAGLSRWGDTPVRRLSKGMRQRLSIARALVHAPPLVILDEPFASLDDDGRRWLEGWLLELRGKRHAICLTSHDRPHCQRFADRIFELRQGRLEEQSIPSARARSA